MASPPFIPQTFYCSSKCCTIHQQQKHQDICFKAIHIQVVVTLGIVKRATVDHKAFCVWKVLYHSFIFPQGDRGDRGPRGLSGSPGPVGPAGAKVCLNTGFLEELSGSHLLAVGGKSSTGDVKLRSRSDLCHSNTEVWGEVRSGLIP